MDQSLLRAAADAFRRLTELPDTGPAERAHWTGWLNQARRLVEQHAARNGVTQYVALNENGRAIGEYHHRARLSDADVDLIHELAAEGLSHAQIAAKFDEAGPPIARSTIGHILSGRRRAHTVMGHRQTMRGGEPIFWPAHIDEFESVVP